MQSHWVMLESPQTKQAAKSMRILLTGHQGYIGSILAPMLVTAGYDVVGLDSGLFDPCVYSGTPVTIPSITKDVRDIDLGDVQNFDAVLHLAGLSNDPLGDLNPELTLDINYRATVRLAELSKKAGVQRFIFSSSCSTYGAAGNDFLNEESEFNPVTPYGQSKVFAEQELALLADDSFSPTYLRNATAYGVSPRLRFDLVVNNLTAWAFTTHQVYLKSDGSPWRPIVHIADISRAFIAALEAPREVVHNAAFNVGRNDENFRIREIADLVAQIVPNCDVSFAPDAGPDTRNYRVDCSKISQQLPNFSAAWTAQKGISELYETYVANGLKLDDFEGETFSRIKYLRSRMADGTIGEDLRLAERQAAHA